MKLSVTQEDLAYGLGVVSRSVAMRSNLPVLSNVLLQAEEGRLRMTTTNLAIALVCVVPATVTEPGETTVPAVLFTDLIGTITGTDPVDITTAKGQTLKFSSGLFDSQLKGLPVEDFPAMTVIDQQPLTRVAQGALREALESTVFAAAASDKATILNSVSATFKGSTLTLAATDNYRIAVKRVALLDPVPLPRTVLVPAQGLSELIRVMTDDEEPVSVVIAEVGNELMFSVEGIDVICRLLDGKFPAYERAIPAGHTTRVVVDREGFLGIARPAALIARQGSNVVQFKISTDGVTISAQAEIGQHVGRVLVGVEGEAVVIGVNARYLNDVLTNVPVDAFEVTLNGGRGACVFKPADDDSYLYLISPVVQPTEGVNK